jgi:hypothetical protein
LHIYTQVFAELEGAEKGRLRQVVDGFAETVGGSFLADKSTMTKNEINRRTEMCAEIFMEFWKDLKWSTVRSLDELPKALRCRLDGIPYTPPKGMRWSADNARDLIWLPE